VELCIHNRTSNESGLAMILKRCILDKKGFCHDSPLPLSSCWHGVYFVFDSVQSLKQQLPYGIIVLQKHLLNNMQSRSNYYSLAINIRACMYYIQHTSSNNHTINWELEAKGKFGTDARTNSSMDRDYTWYCTSSEVAVGDGVCLERFPYFSWICQWSSAY
jgi:hypothetical protein